MIIMNNPESTNRISDYISEKPRIIAIASGKGGVGKSVIAYNLAQHLSHASRVLLIDGDFLTGNLHLLGNVIPEQCWQEDTGETLNIDRKKTAITGNFDLLSSTGANNDGTLPNIKSLMSLLADLRKLAFDYDYIIFDTASGILPHTNLILYAADEVVLVTTPELTAISDCYALYKVLINNNANISPSLLINQEDDTDEVDYIYRKFKAITNRFLNKTPSLFGSLGSGSEIVEAIASQKGLADFAPESSISLQFKQLARHVQNTNSNSEINDHEKINFKAMTADIRE